MGHARWRTFALWNAEHQLQIQLAESTGLRRSYNRQLLWWLSLAALVLWPAMVLVVWFVITRSLEPLEQTAAAVATRTTDDLHPIVPAADVPAEVLPLLGALNRLLARMRGALDYERQFTADAAHELRTPLAAIRAHAQVLQRARDADERANAAHDVMAGVDRGGRVVDQLLALARVDANADVATESGQVDLEELVRQQCALHEPFAQAQGITLEAHTSPVTVHGSWMNFSVLLRNLIDNALRYTPRGGRVIVGCSTTSQGAELWVEDNGLGVAPEERERIFERFYRVPGHDQFGSGLGLSIVRRIAELHGATVGVADAAPGARFSVYFSGRSGPAPAPSAPPETR
jgi:signal transduction histidine kinase